MLSLAVTGLLGCGVVRRVSSQPLKGIASKAISKSGLTRPAEDVRIPDETIQKSVFVHPVGPTYSLKRMIYGGFLSCSDWLALIVNNFKVSQVRDRWQFIGEQESSSLFFDPRRSLAFISANDSAVESLSCSIVAEGIKNMVSGDGTHIDHDPRSFGIEDGRSIVSSSARGVLCGDRLFLNVVKASRRDEECPYCAERDDYIKPIVHLGLGTILLFFGGWLVYDYGDGDSWTRKILSCTIFVVGWLLLFFPWNW